MSTIATTIRLNDGMSSTLNRIQTASIQTIRNMERMQSTVNSLTRSLEEAERINPQIVNTQMYSNAVSAIEQMRGQIYDAANGTVELEDANETYNNSLENTVTKWISIGAVIAGAKKLMDLSDTYAQTNARLSLITDDVEALQNKIFAVAKDSRVSYQAIADTVAKLGMQAGDAFNNSTDEVLAFSNLLNKVFTTSGLDSTGIESTMYNLTQSLSSGKLLGQDYRIIKQNAPEIVKILENYYNVTRAELDEMVSDGKVSSQDLKSAMFQAADDINEKFESMPMTWSQVFTNMMNKLYQASLPLLEAVNWLANNLDVIAPIVLGLAGAIVIYQVAVNGVVAATKAWAAAQAVLNVLAMHPLALILIGILAIIAATYAVVAVVNKVTGSSISALGIIFAGLYTLGAIVNNICAAIYNSFAFVINGINDAFVHVINDIIQLFLGLANTALTVIDLIAKAIDKVFGTNFSESTSNWLNNVSNLAKDINEAANSNNDIMPYLDYANISDAQQKGYAKGVEIQQKLKGTFSDNSTEELLKSINGVMGTDSTGGKAIKTTSSDDLLTDEDIQLLLDVATRDYQLSYQAVTPNITVSFGDVRETADVDSVLDVVGTRIEEMINGDTEVMD